MYIGQALINIIKNANPTENVYFDLEDPNNEYAIFIHTADNGSPNLEGIYEEVFRIEIKDINQVTLDNRIKKVYKSLQNQFNIEFEGLNIRYIRLEPNITKLGKYDDCFESFFQIVVNYEEY